jgi:hypothetical protein
VIALGQAHGAEQQADRDLAGEIVDELEFPSFAYALERPVGISSVGATSCSLVLRVNAAWLSARNRSCRGGSVVPNVAPARPGSSSIMLPCEEEKVSQSRAACTMSS